MPKVDKDGTVTWTPAQHALLDNAVHRAEVVVAALGSIAVPTATKFTCDSVEDRFKEAMNSLDYLVGFAEDLEKWEFKNEK
jgi:hypothetical protein